eukprot:UN3919
MDVDEVTEKMVNDKGWAWDGTPNVQSWCSSPQYYEFITRCSAGKLVEAGQLQYELTKDGMFGGLTRESDGSYCFIEGHCVNDAVNESTTVEDTVHLCDERFGRKAWAQFGRMSAPPQDVPGWASEEAVDPRNGFTGQSQTRPFLLAACAMGNFHCDVMMCKETYCKIPYYVKKYGHFLKDNGWTK